MAERIPREEVLRRVHGPGALFAAAYGNVGSSIYYALGIVALYALGLTPVAFLVSGLIFAFTAASYAEVTAMYPEAGGSSSFARRAFNEMASFLAGWAQMLTYVVTIAISAYFAPHYLSSLWAPLGESPGDIICATVLIAGLALLNVRGTDESSKLNLGLSIVDISTSLILITIGLFLVFDPQLLITQVELGIAPTWSNFALAIAVGMVAYTGIETISNMSEEARDPGRTIPRGVGAVVIVVVALYMLLPIVALSAMPVTETAAGFSTELGTTYVDNPMVGIVENLGLSAGITDVMAVTVGALAAVILIIAANAGVIGVSRLTFSMGQYRQLPDKVRALHPKFKTPWVAILVFSAVAAVALLPGTATFLATLYAFGATLSFTIAHLAVIALRVREPDRERPWQPPFNLRIGGHPIPLTAIVGGLGTAAAFVVAMVLDPVVLLVGCTWLLLGLVGYVVFRRYQRISLTKSVKIEGLTPLGVQDVEYRSVLVAFEGSALPEDVLRTATTLASTKERAIHLLSLLTVPTHLPLDVDLGPREEKALAALARGQELGGRRVTTEAQRIRPGQAGSMIVERAKAIDAAAIVMPLEYRDGVPLYGKRLQTVLSERPCRVIVVGEPGNKSQWTKRNVTFTGAAIPAGGGRA